MAARSAAFTLALGMLGSVSTARCGAVDALQGATSSPLAELPCPGGLEATFIQIGPREIEHGVAEWERDLGLLRSLGIRRVILQYSGDEHGPFDKRPGGAAPVGALLRAASAIGTSVVLGLHLDPRWPGAFPAGSALPPPLDRPAEMDALVEACTSSASCVGWYLPEEIDDSTWASPERTFALRGFLARAAGALRARTPGMQIVISPFYTGHLDPGAHARWWGELLVDRPVEVVMLQDGVGSGHGSAEVAREMLAELAPVAASRKVAVWSVVELFAQIHGPPRDALPFEAAPAEVDTVRRSLELERAAGVPLAAFAVLNYMDPSRGPAAARLHDGYAAFCEEQAGGR